MSNQTKKERKVKLNKLSNDRNIKLINGNRSFMEKILETNKKLFVPVYLLEQVYPHQSILILNQQLLFLLMPQKYQMN